MLSGINRPKMRFGGRSNVPGTRRAHVWAFICELSSRLHAQLNKNKEGGEELLWACFSTKSEALLLSTSAGTKSLSQRFAVSAKPCNLHHFAMCTRVQSKTQSQSACCPVGFNKLSSFIDEQYERLHPSSSVLRQVGHGWQIKDNFEERWS